jgi:hypothetical protein
MKSKREVLLGRIAAAALWATVLIPGTANAGPPYRTDDPNRWNSIIGNFTRSPVGHM